MNVAFSGCTLNIDTHSIEMPWPVLSAAEDGELVFVLLDPDAYLLDPNYKSSRRAGAAAIRNLVAFNREGERIWKAEFPEASDYYYKITSIAPLMVQSFSSYSCEIDRGNGRITNKVFCK